MKTFIVVDCEAPFGVGSPAVGDMTCFGAVVLPTKESFYGKDCSRETFLRFDVWLKKVCHGNRPVFVSDNPAYDFQWINFYFWKYMNGNPFGHSARRIGDFYAGVVKDFYQDSRWKKYRVTVHDHHPVHDALGNVEALEHILLLAGEKK